MNTIDVVDLASDLIKVGSLSGQEHAMAQLVMKRMQELGYTDISVDENGSVLGYVGPRDGELALLFDAHMDVVPVAGQWTVDPFGAERRDGRLYGRGATDMKGALAAALCGVSQAAATGKLHKRVAVSASVLEEVIEGYAIGAVLDRCRPEAVVICEPSKLQVKVGQKGRQEILLTLHGKPAHAALPHAGRNPIEAAATALAALRDMPLPQDDILGSAFLVPTDIVSDPYPSISLIPSSVTIRFDRRTLSGETWAEVRSAIDACLRQAGLEHFSLEIATAAVSTYTGQTIHPERDLPAWHLPDGHALVEAMCQAVRDAGRDPETSTWWFCTNGSEAAGRRGLPTIGLGPGREEDAHTIDESVEIEQLVGARDIYACLCLRMAGVQN